MDRLLSQRLGFALHLLVAAFVVVVLAPSVLSPPAIAQPISSSNGTELDRLSKALSYQLELAYRFDPEEHHRRHAAIAMTFKAWNASSRTAADYQAIDRWFRTAIRSSMPGSKDPMPTPPTFSRRIIVTRPTGLSPRVSSSSSQSDRASGSSTLATEDLRFDRLAASRLWANSPAAVSLDLDQLLAEATAFHSTGPSTGPSTEQETASRIGSEKFTSSTLSPSRLAARKRRPTRRLSDSLNYDSQPKPLESLPRDFLAPLQALNGANLLVASEFGSSEGPFAPLAGVDDAATVVSDTDSSSTGYRPPSTPTTFSYQSSKPKKKRIDLDSLANKAVNYRYQLRAISDALQSSQTKTAFELSDLTRELEELGRERRFISLYLPGLTHNERIKVGSLTSADVVIALLRRQARARRRELVSLPAQSVRAELIELGSIENSIPQIEADHR